MFLLFFFSLVYFERCHCYLSVDCTFLCFFVFFYFFPLSLPNMFNSTHLHASISTLSLQHRCLSVTLTCVCIFLTSNLCLFQCTCGSAFSSRLTVKVGLFPCLAPCAGSAHPRQHHSGQPRHTGHPADPRGGRPEPWGAGPDDLDGEVRRRAGQATRCGHTGGNQGYLQHEAVSPLKHQ